MEMDEIIALVREYPVDIFFLGLALLATIERVASMVINSRRPRIVCVHGHCCEVCDDICDQEDE